MIAAVNFVVYSWEKWRQLLVDHPPHAQDLASLIISNEDIWTVLTYLHLSAKGLRATVSQMPVAGKINILDGISLGTRILRPDVYCVGCRGDGPYPGGCQAVIHQNLLPQPPRLPSFYIPQWRQPGLIPRDASRTQIKNIGFLGHARINLAESFREPDFVAALRRNGYDLVVRSKTDGHVNWHDYSDLDLILAVRTIPIDHLLLKPANKLTNSWAAGVPALLGPEPAIEAIKVGGLDFMEVARPADVFEALQTFKSAPHLYREMVTHGRLRARDYDDHAVANRWFEVLGRIREDFLGWQAQNSAVGRYNYLRRIARQRQSMEDHERQIHRPYRKLGCGRQWWLS